MSNKEKRKDQEIIEEKIDEAMVRLTVSDEEEDYDEEWEEEEDWEEEDDWDEDDEASEILETYEEDYEDDEVDYEADRQELQVELIQPDRNRKPGKRSARPQKGTPKIIKIENAKPRSKKVQESRSARPGKYTYVPMTDEEFSRELMPAGIPSKKKHKGLKVVGLTAAMLVLTAGCAYGAATVYYTRHFFQGTTINGINCSNRTAYEAEQAIANYVENYSIEVVSRNAEPESISGNEINYKYLSNGEVLHLLKQQKSYEWIKGYFEPVSYTTQQNVTFDKALLQAEVKSLGCAKEENQVAPENAYVALQGSEFAIVPETQGSELVMKEAYKALNTAISASQAAIDFGSIENVYASAEITSDSPELQATRDAYNNYTRASITYTFGNDSVVLDGNTLKDWLQFDEKGQLVQDDASFQQHITEFVAQLAANYDTVGTSRAFTATNGRTVYVYGSAYGWKIDQAAEAAQLTEEIRTGAQVTREPVYSMTANSRGYNDLGNTYIEVDMGTQHMYYYQNGSIIFDSDFVSGNMSYADRQTPEGIYTLYNKKSPDVLRGSQKPDGTYEYEQPVSYWMPFNGGVGFHDAPWQPYFGGDRYLEGGSHGCINLPTGSAATLYSIIQYNVPIVCFY